MKQLPIWRRKMIEAKMRRRGRKQRALRLARERDLQAERRELMDVSGLAALAEALSAER